jgi:galactose-1-phosphate uridylyltransferase
MSELRQNLATQEWVIIAPERLKGKPLQPATNALMDSYPEYDPGCPFCPGNEKRFENVVIDFIPHPDPGNDAQTPWLVRNIENKFKIFEEFEFCPVAPTEFEKVGIYALFGDMGDQEAADFADCLRVTMSKLYVALSNPDFNLVLRNPPYPLSGVPYYDWHMQVIPHTRLPGGFERGSRIMVNVMLPEKCAKILRETGPPGPTTRRNNG